MQLLMRSTIDTVGHVCALVRSDVLRSRCRAVASLHVPTYYAMKKLQKWDSRSVVSFELTV